MARVEKEQYDMWDYWHPGDAITHWDDDWQQFERDQLSLNMYQKEVSDLVLTEGDDRLIENTLGLVGEAGEVAEKVKKMVRDGTPINSQIVRELGDVLFYVAALADHLDYDLSEVANQNLDKLKDRKRRGVLQGSGDNR